jgi:toxin CcdB
VIPQNDFLSQGFDTVVVAPLQMADSSKFADRLNPAVTVDNCSFVLLAPELLTVRKSQLGAPRGSVSDQRDQIIAALDMLFTGI